MRISKVRYFGGQGIKWLARDKVWSGFVIGLFFVFGFHRSLVVYSHAQSSYPLAASALGASSSSSHASFSHHHPLSPPTQESRFIYLFYLFYYAPFRLFYLMLFLFNALFLYLSVCAEAGGQQEIQKDPYVPANKKLLHPNLRFFFF